MNQSLLKLLETTTDKIKQYEQDVKPRYIKADYQKMIAKCISAIISPQSRGITVYGDFDNDGIISAIMLQRYLRRIAMVFRGEEDGDKFVRTAYSQRKNSFGLTENEYLEFSRESSLVIAVDNGSSSTFLHEDIPNLVILDHHECKTHYPFIINPNAGREDGLNYSTSGGKVVFDFILNLDNNMNKIIDAYQPNEEYMKMLQVLASFTLISDMAVMDKGNRKFTEDALKYLRDNKTKLPITMRLGDDFSSRNISFEVISQINAMGRMEEDLHVCEDFIAPRNLDAFLHAQTKIDAINKKKKSLVAGFYKKVVTSGVMDNGKKITFVHDSGLKTGLLGLFANKLSKSKRDGPVICMSPSEDEVKIATSARGRNAFRIIEKLFEYDDIQGRFGGHPSACGASIELRGIQSKEMFSRINQYLSEIEDNNPELFEQMRLDGIVTKPITLTEYVAISNDYGLQCGGVDLHKKLYLPISGYEIKGSKGYSSGWHSVTLVDSDASSNKEVKLWCEESTLDQMAQEHRSIIFELLPNSDHSIHSVIDTDKVSNIVSITEEAKPQQPIELSLSEFESFYKNKATANPLFVVPIDINGNLAVEISLKSSLPIVGIPTMTDITLLGEEDAYFTDKAEYILKHTMPAHKKIMDLVKEDSSITLIVPKEGFSNSVNELENRSPQISNMLKQSINMLLKSRETEDATRANERVDKVGAAKEIAKEEKQSATEKKRVPPHRVDR